MLWTALVSKLCCIEFIFISLWASYLDHNLAYLFLLWLRCPCLPCALSISWNSSVLPILAWTSGRNHLASILAIGVFLSPSVFWCFHLILANRGHWVTCYHLWCSDTFNENTPPTNDPKYISSLGASVFEAMSKGDKDAVWLMQVSSSSFQTIHPTRTPPPNPY